MPTTHRSSGWAPQACEPWDDGGGDTDGGTDTDSDSESDSDTDGDPGQDNGGGGCHVDARGTGGGWLMLFGLGALPLLRRRRR